MKILVIDDDELQRNAALILLSDHQITVVKDTEEAEFELLEGSDMFNPSANRYTNPEGYDLVLTDLAMPYESQLRKLGEGDQPGDGTPLPLGLGVASMAMRSGIPIAIVSAGGEDEGPGSDHHGHPFVKWAKDHFCEIPGRLWLFADHNCPRTEIGGVRVKDWKVVLEKLLHGGLSTQ